MAHVETPDFERLAEARQIAVESRADRDEIERLEADIDAKRERITTLEWRLGEMVALTQDDIDQLRITPTPTRIKIIDECRDLLGLKGR